MTEDEVIECVSNLPGVVAMTAGRENDAPESAWGDSFFFYDPAGDTPEDRRFPFATIFVSDYDGFDTSSDLNRPGVFRLNINVGRTRFQELVGYSPAAHADNAERLSYAVMDVLLPHPGYATQAWVAILNPERTADLARSLLEQAHSRAVARHRPGRPAGQELAVTEPAPAALQWGRTTHSCDRVHTHMSCTCMSHHV